MGLYGCRSYGSRCAVARSVGRVVVRARTPCQCQLIRSLKGRTLRPSRRERFPLVEQGVDPPNVTVQAVQRPRRIVGRVSYVELVMKVVGKLRHRNSTTVVGRSVSLVLPHNPVVVLLCILAALGRRTL